MTSDSENDCEFESDFKIDEHPLPVETSWLSWEPVDPDVANGIPILERFENLFCPIGVTQQEQTELLELSSLLAKDDDSKAIIKFDQLLIDKASSRLEVLRVLLTNLKQNNIRVCIVSTCRSSAITDLLDELTFVKKKISPNTEEKDLPCNFYTSQPSGKLEIFLAEAPSVDGMLDIQHSDVVICLQSRVPITCIKKKKKRNPPVIRLFTSGLGDEKQLIFSKTNRDLLKAYAKDPEIILTTDDVSNLPVETIKRIRKQAMRLRMWIQYSVPDFLNTLPVLSVTPFQWQTSTVISGVIESRKRKADCFEE